MLDAKVIMDYLPKAIKAICKINLSPGFGSGFFCRIPFTENNNNLFLPALITNNHVISADFINSKNDIQIEINGETKQISLKERKIWTDEKMDFTCIQIKKEDNIHTFYNLDDNALEENDSNDYYLKKNVLIFAINKNNMNVGFSNGLIKHNNNGFFFYTCNTYPGCSGGCVVNGYNNSVIGIHRGECKIEENKYINQGIYIWNVIKYIKDSKESLLLSVIQNFNN